MKETKENTYDVPERFHKEWENDKNNYSDDYWTARKWFAAGCLNQLREDNKMLEKRHKLVKRGRK